MERLEHAWNQASGPTTCPGCRRTTGTPGALCPHCGSRYPSPRVGLIGVGIAAFGGLCLLVAFISTGGLFQDDRFHGSSPFEGMGLIGLLVGGAMFVYSVGRAGPEKQTSCCGCSCVLALAVLPAAGLVLWSSGGAQLALFALPAWPPLTLFLDCVMTAGWRVQRAMRTFQSGASPTTPRGSPS